MHQQPTEAPAVEVVYSLRGLPVEKDDSPDAQHVQGPPIVVDEGVFGPGSISDVEQDVPPRD